MGEIIRIDMGTLSVKKEPVPADLQVLGGRYVTSKLVAKEVPAVCNPLGPDNKLIFAPGLVTGSIAPSSGRISVGTKSPLTGGIKESNAGTPVAQALGKLGVKALIFENWPKDNNVSYVMYMDKEKIEFTPMNELKLKYTSDTVRILKEKFGSKVKVICIGPAGEQKLAASGICFVDADGVASRFAARGGVGALRKVEFHLVGHLKVHSIERPGLLEDLFPLRIRQAALEAGPFPREGAGQALHRGGVGAGEGPKDEASGREPEGRGHRRRG
jgi:aldehyde:ferredoxin oxidoreductase